MIRGTDIGVTATGRGGSFTAPGMPSGFCDCCDCCIGGKFTGFDLPDRAINPPNLSQRSRQTIWGRSRLKKSPTVVSCSNSLYPW